MQKASDAREVVWRSLLERDLGRLEAVWAGSHRLEPGEMGQRRAGGGGVPAELQARHWFEKRDEGWGV